jgi:hypothetical protein
MRGSGPASYSRLGIGPRRVSSRKADGAVDHRAARQRLASDRRSRGLVLVSIDSAVGLGPWQCGLPDREAHGVDQVVPAAALRRGVVGPEPAEPAGARLVESDGD